MDEQIVIFKNEKTGDLIHSVNSIKEIVSKYPNKKINIFLSHYNVEMKFLFNYENVKIHTITEKIIFKDKIKIFNFFLTTNISKAFIFKPSSFLFLLPLFFKPKKIKFYGICVKKKNYLRPPIFLRKFLYRYVINDRESKNIRKSIHELHLDLVLKKNNSNYNMATLNKKIIPNFNVKDYFLVHYNKFKFKKLNWNLNDFFILVDELKDFNKNIVITNDINDYETNKLIKQKYIDNNTNKVFYFPNVKGEFFFNIIGNADLVIAFHGMITSIGAIQNTKVLDLFNCNIKNKDDFYRYKNAFHEFKPKLKGYEFLIPKTSIKKSLKKIKHLISNGRKISYKTF